MKTAIPSRRELNLTLQMCPKGRAKNDCNLERVGKELWKPSRRSHGGLLYGFYLQFNCVFSYCQTLTKTKCNVFQFITKLMWKFNVFLFVMNFKSYVGLLSTEQCGPSADLLGRSSALFGRSAELFGRLVELFGHSPIIP